ncbi:MAG: CRISPR-associated endonuclease Cas2 [Candidatus Taylorbacteria bacterium RIFCSPHIGHO2_02_FULL_46_13]|uniref:CRISPR-associated endonuclease Cas2 n=1 Tax=Candidatus Taylorbacteria bacterium RIFCSPHIGHO2_02_FULL_46_13 TaxID=1802312 RepID=A0A1G2MTB3_9BACT|nr:MAG: CRISPR-associated endonuclease Cas2 [Candidatus Taylorbacteria bacterium RIFCSPHIGHO2_02_FULL_46_13]
MGILEKEMRKRTRRRNLQKILLRTVAAAGFMSIALLAPNALQALAKLGFINFKRKYQEKTLINRSRDRLIKAGLLARNEEGLLRLTPKGMAKLRQLELVDYKLPRPRRWDGKWRVLIFDIKEERKSLRDKVRRTLIALGFKRLQDSVWVYPYDCEDLITLLKADFKIGKDLLYLVVEKMEYDVPLRKQFGLALP